ncbi:MAG: dinitrogenase iron-molybdenum cofactor biosynthesis protein [Spirochaetaceae bacterium]|jgi:nitrogen fixation protein NifB|nr:dinitrogenase iron-molybdenum cofactor biosynthesis protein [Spirochaetaceae bacterium]
MSWRIALASIDNLLVTEHFGRSKWFYIRDLEPDGTSKTVERRLFQPLCAACADHNPAGLNLDALRDCQAVLTVKAGPAVHQQLEAAGISVFEGPAVIDEALKKLAAYYVQIRRKQWGN